MKTTQLVIAAAIAAFGTAAFAQEATTDRWMGATASKTIEQVKAELVQARRDGSIKSGGATYDFAGRMQSTKSRDQIRAELAAAQDSGEYTALNSEVPGLESLPRATVYAKAAR